MPQRTLLEQLREHSTIVADSADLDQLKEFGAEDATTNPTLVLQAARMPRYAQRVNEHIGVLAKPHQGKPKAEIIDHVTEGLAVYFGCELLKIVPGRVSTEVSASLSFDIQGSVACARRLIEAYAKQGIGKERVLIKMAATWEGCEACKILQAEGINCNMTLIFSAAQAEAAAKAKAFLISPFVGRILDWHKKTHPELAERYVGQDDPGVMSVESIYMHYKAKGHTTIVMGASFRNKEEIIALAGCDKLTISPKLLTELRDTKGLITRFLNSNVGGPGSIPELEDLDEKKFRWLLNQDPMANEKLAEGITNFHKDTLALKEFVSIQI